MPWSRPAWRRVLLLVTGNALVLVLLLLLVEGGASALLFLRDASGTEPLAERRHTRYDPELGWVNEPGVRIADFYGPGLPLSTNTRGFRGTAEVDSAVPPGRFRVICVGDSFTLGFGVGDEETWCAQLGRLDPRLEIVNMGQGGYGVDQSFLWYRRDGAPLGQDLVVAAFIPHDFRRMEHPDFLGYAKPMLRADGDSLRLEHVPVPRRGYGLTSWFTRNAAPLRELRVSQLLARLAQRMRPAAAPTAVDREAIVAGTWDAAALVMAEMQALATNRGGRLAWVLLPTEYELDGRPPVALAEFLAARAEQLGVPFLDLHPVFLAQPGAERQRLFLAPGEARFPHAAGHYSPAGNALVARTLRDSLAARGLLLQE